jgi:transitional endoplasmic reticulum ATPase
MKSSLISDVLGFFDNRAVYAKYNVPWKRGIILHGVPGNGKTASIKALMNALYSRADPVPALYVKSFETNCQTEQYAIRSIFQQARSVAPCLLVFEDLDSLVKDGIRSYFLNEVDGLESNDGILMIGSTNHLERLDPAISKRPSRFDRKYHFRIPGEGERRAYVEFWREKLGMEEFTQDVMRVVVGLTEGFSFAYLKEVFVMVVLRLVRGGDDDTEGETEGKGQGEEKVEDQDTEKDETCTCVTKCATCDKPLKSNDEAAKKTDEDKETKLEAKKIKSVLSAVEVPEHLADNFLLKIIKQQIRILHAEMDNTEEGREGKGVSGGE